MILYVLDRATADYITLRVITEIPLLLAWIRNRRYLPHNQANNIHFPWRTVYIEIIIKGINIRKKLCVPL